MAWPFSPVSCFACARVRLSDHVRLTAPNNDYRHQFQFSEPLTSPLHQRDSDTGCCLGEAEVAVLHHPLEIGRGRIGLEMLKTYSRDAEAFVGHAGAGLL
jgi:hypothetical protein